MNYSTRRGLQTQRVETLSTVNIKALMLCIRAFPCSGGRTRTDGLRVMSPTSYQLLHPAMWTANVRKLCCRCQKWLKYKTRKRKYLQAHGGQADAFVFGTDRTVWNGRGVGLFGDPPVHQWWFSFKKDKEGASGAAGLGPLRLWIVALGRWTVILDYQ